MIRVVVDTNVLVSAVISPTGPNARMFDLVSDGTVRPYLSDAVLAEYYDVFEHYHLKHLDKGASPGCVACWKRWEFKSSRRGG